MRSHSRLLTVAVWWCGRHTAQSVFEPLLADWRHEIEAARAAGRLQHLNAIISGSRAYTASMARCTMTGGWLPTSRAAQIVALTFILAFDAALFLLWIASLPSGRTLDLSSTMTRAFLLSAAPLAFAPILLPALFLMRRDPRSTARHAVSVIAVGAVLAAGVVWLRSPEHLNRYFATFASLERQYQRTLANDRAGRVTYPGTAIRERGRQTTIEQRRADYERFMAARAQHDATRPPLTWAQRLIRFQPVGLAMLFGVMGWTLAGLGPVSYVRAAMWWALMYLATLTFGGMPRTITGLAGPVLPHAYAIPVFTLATTALVIASWRRADGRTLRCREQR